MADEDDGALDRVGGALDGALLPGEMYLLVFLTPATDAEGRACSRVRTVSSVPDQGVRLRLLAQVLENLAEQRVPKSEQLGGALGELGEAKTIAVFEVLEAVKGALEKGQGIPQAATEEIMLAFALNAIHDRGASREAALASCLSIIGEEWSTPNTEGRLIAATAPLGNAGQARGQG